MNWWLFVPAIVVVVVVFYDAFVTTVSATSPGGPVTQRFGTAIWRVLRRMAPSPGSPVLTAAGPLIVFVMLVFWLGGLWVGWTLLFSVDPQAVAHSDTAALADGWSRAYFAGYALYTLGLGDFAPQGALWQVLTSAATINGFVLLSMSVTYLVPVVMAVSERRQHGMLLYGLGPRAQDILVAAWDGQSFEDLGPLLHEWTSTTARAAQKYLTYPVLHFFHSPTRSTALEPGLVALDEAVLLLEHGVAEGARPRPIVLGPMRASLDRFEEAATEFTGVATVSPPPPTLEPLRRAGIPTVDEESFRSAVAEQDVHRRVLAALVGDANWRWEDTAEIESATANS